LGAILRHPSTFHDAKVSERRKDLRDMNRLAIINDGKYQYARSDDHWLKLVMQLVSEWRAGEIVDLRPGAHREIEGLTMARFQDTPLVEPQGGAMAKSHYWPYVPVDNSGRNAGDEVIELAPLDVINLYEDTDLTGEVRVINPMSVPTSRPLRSSEQPNKVVTSEKIALTKYPLRSRPVLTKMIFGELNASSLRMENRVLFEHGPYDATAELLGLAKHCFRTDHAEIVKKYTPITYNMHATIEWLRQRTGVTELDAELDKMMTEPLEMHDLNRVNVHQKLESLLKSKPIKQFREQIVRIIVWQAKAIAAIFSPIFLQAKARLKELLRPEILYCDGYRPDEIAAHVRGLKIGNEKVGYLSDDGDKQDKRTTWRALEVEMMLYKNYLKVDDNVISLWRRCHWYWHYKGQFLRGVCHAMRQTGQATTAIGNVIINLLVHWRMWKNLGNDFIQAYILGDDNITISKRSIDADSHKKFCKSHFNMIQEAEFNWNQGVFLQMLVGVSNKGHLTMTPNYVRLKNRFEFTNGVSANPIEAINARRQSYCMMLGDIPEVNEINADEGWDLPLYKYYETMDAIKLASLHHGITEEWARSDFTTLIGYLKKPQVTVYGWTHFTCRF